MSSRGVILALTAVLAFSGCALLLRLVAVGPAAAATITSYSAFSLADLDTVIHIDEDLMGGAWVLRLTDIEDVPPNGTKHVQLRMETTGKGHLFLTVKNSSDAVLVGNKPDVDLGERYIWLKHEGRGINVQFSPDPVNVAWESVGVVPAGDYFAHGEAHIVLSATADGPGDESTLTLNDLNKDYSPPGDTYCLGGNLPADLTDDRWQRRTIAPNAVNFPACTINYLLGRIDIAAARDAVGACASCST